MSTQVTSGLQVRKSVELTIDGKKITTPEGSTLLDACRASGKDIPTLCYGDTEKCMSRMHGRT
jgi:predicted molibdopterin-dependent oxidoreductase YjgC